MAAEFRVGYGWDSHEFASGRPLLLGGIAIEHSKGLKGHSDGDVLLHALCDALLGALSLGDIGTHFPSNDARWRGASSDRFVAHALALVQQKGWRVVNADATVILEKPRLQPHSARIRESLARLLNIPLECASVKAKTPEGMGTDNAAIAHAIVLLAK